MNDIEKHMRSVHSVIGSLSPEVRAMKAWRYFDLPKFISMLQQKGLYFSRSDLLGDRFEGSVTRAKQKVMDLLLANPPEGKTREDVQITLDTTARFFAQLRQTIYVNCWHLGAHESMAMWSGYGGGPHGVAISSKVAQLDELLPDFFDNEKEVTQIYLGKVMYEDLTSETRQIPNSNNLYGPFIYKSIVHEHERELRAIFWNPIPLTMQSGLDAGHFVKVDLNRLVDRIVISPLAGEWFCSLIKDICERYGFDFEITTSVMAMEPVF